MKIFACIIVALMIACQSYGACPPDECVIPGCPTLNSFKRCYAKICSKANFTDAEIFCADKEKDMKGNFTMQVVCETISTTTVATTTKAAAVTAAPVTTVAVTTTAAPTTSDTTATTNLNAGRRRRETTTPCKNLESEFNNQNIKFIDAYEHYYDCLKNTCTQIPTDVTKFIQQFDIKEPLVKICQTCGSASITATGILLGFLMVIPFIA